MKKIKLAVVGCGDRGNVYASYALRYPEEAEIVAVVDVNEVALNITGDKFNLPKERRFSNVNMFLDKKIECDSVINATMDKFHYDIAVKLINAGYNQLLEKPIVNNYEQLIELQKLANLHKTSIVVCHVLRYTPFYSSIKRFINEGKIGTISTIEMNEHVGVEHFADSFVRGKWSDEDVCGSGLLLQKCCHDLDLMCWLNNATTPVKVSSMADRGLFIPENAPKGATEYCYQCPYNSTCLYDAKKIHVDCDYFYFQTWRELNKPHSEITKEEKLEYLKRSDYGKCVYSLNRKLVDRQMAMVKFKNGSVCNLTVVGGCVNSGRNIHIVGSKGEIYGKLESDKFVVLEGRHDGDDINTKSKEIDVRVKEDCASGHSNGDESLMRAYVRYLNGDESCISLTSINDSINGHVCVFASEQSRKEDRVIDITEYCK